jgi:hypothetical protein
MFIHNLGGHLSESEKGFSIEIRPDTNGPKVRTLRVALARELGGEMPERAKVVRLKKKDGSDGILMLFPEERPDNRYFIIAGFSHWKHRSGVGIDSQESTGKIMEEAHGYGAWGSGVAFFAVLEEGQRIVSTRHGDTRHVIWIEDTEVKSSRLTDEAYAELVGIENFEMEEI